MNDGTTDDYPFQPKVPEGDNRERLVCTDCGWIHYDNPKVIVGAVCTWQDRYLLCRRAIAPRFGYWTIPAGYMEQGETAEEGARRETAEEACARIEIDVLLGVYSIPRISQIQLIYRARLLDPDVSAGSETSEVQLVPFSGIPWGQLAFPTVYWSLKHHHEAAATQQFQPFTVSPEQLDMTRPQ